MALVPIGVGTPLRAAAAESTPQIAFHIPAQPLDRALEAYNNTTGLEVLYNSNLAVDRRSSPVNGILVPRAALQQLLSGTGLVARYTDARSFVLVPAQLPALPSAVSATLPSPEATWHVYYARIQETLRDALCRSTEARRGRYRVAAQLWLSSEGTVDRYRRLSSTGEADIDGLVDRTLHGLQIGPPPAGFAQPVTVLIVPQAPDVTLGCDATGFGVHLQEAAQ